MPLNIANHKKKQNMHNKDLKIAIDVDRPASEVFKAITNVRGWWSENIEGRTDGLQEEFLYHYKDVHICKLRITELVAGKKIVWLVLENHFNFTSDQSEWKGNRIVFELTEKDGRTRLEFTHVGLTTAYECYEVCRDAWGSYIQGSLKNLITTGKGNPNTREHDLNKELIQKWGLPDK